MQQRRRQLLVVILTLVMTGVWMVAAWAQGRGECSQKAAQTLENLDQWVVEYERQMASAEPVLKPKYREWIGELTKLRSLVADARAKLDNPSSCPSDECVADQCSLIDIADQQVAQLVKETEQQLGAGSRFGDETGREVLTDDDILGFDEILGASDPLDARQDSYADQSEQSDSPSQGRTGGDVFDESSSEELPPENPAAVASPS